MWEFPVSTAESEHHIWVYYFSSVLWNCLMVPLHLEYSREGLEGRGGKKLNSTGQVEEILVGNSREIALCLGKVTFLAWGTVHDFCKASYCHFHIHRLLTYLPLLCGHWIWTRLSIHTYIEMSRQQAEKWKKSFVTLVGACVWVRSTARRPSICATSYTAVVSARSVTNSARWFTTIKFQILKATALKYVGTWLVFENLKLWVFFPGASLGPLQDGYVAKLGHGYQTRSHTKACEDTHMLYLSWGNLQM